MKHLSINYANDVINNKIPSGIHHVRACKRFLKDLENKKWRWTFDVDKANHSINFVEQCLEIETEKGSVPFKLFDWQIWLFSNLFGWVDKKKPTIRRFREAYLLAGRGNGKSPTAAAIGLYCTFVLGLKGAQGYAIARSSEQAGATFTTMGKFADHLNIAQPMTDQFRVFKHLGQPHIINRPSKAQMLKKLSSDTAGAGKSGYISTFVVADEVMEFQNSHMYDKLMSSCKGDNPTPLFLSLTNAGVAGEGMAWELNERAIKLLDPDDKYRNEREFATIFAIDPNDDPYENEECWHKAAPSLKYGIPSLEFYKNEVLKAKGNPSKQSETDRALFSVWVAGASPWISVSEFEKLTTKDGNNTFPSEEELKKMRCYIGIDLSRTTDLTSITKAWIEPESKKIYLRNHSWIPGGNNIVKKELQDKAPYQTWAKKGYVTIVDKSVMRYEDIINYLKDICNEYDVCGITMDAYRLSDFRETAKRLGFSMYRKGTDEEQGLMCVFSNQGFQRRKQSSPDLFMPQMIEQLENRITEKNIIIEWNPCLLKAAVGSMLKSDENGNRKFDKERSYSRTDPIISLVGSLGLAEKYGGKLTTAEVNNLWLKEFG